MYLETCRLVLRKLEERDFEDYCAYSLGDGEQDRMMGRSPLLTREDVRMNFDWLKDREECGLAIIAKESGSMIGNLTVYRDTPVSGHEQCVGKDGRSLSFCLSRQYRRQGLMEEAVRAVVHRLFADGAEYLHCGCFDCNTPSMALQKKLGFEEVMTQQVEIGNEYFTAVESILLRNTETNE